MYRLSLYNTYNYQECKKKKNKKQNHNINNAHFTGDILNNENTNSFDRQLGHWSIKTLSKNRNICSSNAFFKHLDTSHCKTISRNFSY